MKQYLTKTRKVIDQSFIQLTVASSLISRLAKLEKMQEYKRVKAHAFVAGSEVTVRMIIS